MSGVSAVVIVTFYSLTQPKFVHDYLPFLPPHLPVCLAFPPYRLIKIRWLFISSDYIDRVHFCFWIDSGSSALLLQCPRHATQCKQPAKQLNELMQTVHSAGYLTIESVYQ